MEQADELFDQVLPDTVRSSVTTASSTRRALMTLIDEMPLLPKPELGLEESDPILREVRSGARSPGPGYYHCLFFYYPYLI